MKLYRLMMIGLSVLLTNSCQETDKSSTRKSFLSSAEGARSENATSPAAEKSSASKLDGNDLRAYTLAQLDNHLNDSLVGSELEDEDVEEAVESIKDHLDSMKDDFREDHKKKIKDAEEKFDEDHDGEISDGEFKIGIKTIVVRVRGFRTKHAESWLQKHERICERVKDLVEELAQDAPFLDILYERISLKCEGIKIPLKIVKSKVKICHFLVDDLKIREIRLPFVKVVFNRCHRTVDDDDNQDDDDQNESDDYDQGDRSMSRDDHHSHPAADQTEEEYEPGSGCVTAGCNNELCLDASIAADVSSICEWKEEYSCLKHATCGRGSDGKCVWKKSSEFNQCIDKTSGS